MNRTDYVYVTVIAASPEDVWKGLTTPEFTRQYWHDTRVRSDFRPGSSIEFLNADDEAAVIGRIETADYPRELAYSWQFTGDSPASQDRESRVTFKLVELDVGTRLTVIHDRIEEGSTTATMISVGWPHVIAGLKTLLETGKAIDFTAAETTDCPGQQAASG